MKTLDEVIKAFSEVNKEVGCGDCQFNDAESDDIPCEMTDCIFNDALHYLNEYQRDKQIFAYDIAKRNLELSERNEPLTWDELKQMEEKPVWLVNTATEEAEWVLVGECFVDDEMRICRMFRDYANYIFKECYEDGLWQAYRKERK